MRRAIAGGTAPTRFPVPLCVGIGPRLTIGVKNDFPDLTPKLDSDPKAYGVKFNLQTLKF